MAVQPLQVDTFAAGGTDDFFHKQVNWQPCPDVQAVVEIQGSWVNGALHGNNIEIQLHQSHRTYTIEGEWENNIPTSITLTSHKGSFFGKHILIDPIAEYQLKGSRNRSPYFRYSRFITFMDGEYTWWNGVRQKGVFGIIIRRQYYNVVNKLNLCPVCLLVTDLIDFDVFLLNGQVECSVTSGCCNFGYKYNYKCAMVENDCVAQIKGIKYINSYINRQNNDISNSRRSLFYPKIINQTGKIKITLESVQKEKHDRRCWREKLRVVCDDYEGKCQIDGNIQLLSTDNVIHFNLCGNNRFQFTNHSHVVVCCGYNDITCVSPCHVVKLWSLDSAANDKFMQELIEWKNKKIQFLPLLIGHKSLHEYYLQRFLYLTKKFKSTNKHYLIMKEAIDSYKNKLDDSEEEKDNCRQKLHYDTNLMELVYQTNNAECIKHYVQMVYAIDMRSICDNQKQNPLHYACATGQTDLVKWLITRRKYRPWLNVVDKYGDTPLSLAVGGKHLEMVKILLNLCTKELVTQRNKYQSNCIQMAIVADTDEILKCLIEKCNEFDWCKSDEISGFNSVTFAIESYV